jgi:ComEC/Rec2-related protein
MTNQTIFRLGLVFIVLGIIFSYFSISVFFGIILLGGLFFDRKFYILFLCFVFGFVWFFVFNPYVINEEFVSTEAIVLRDGVCLEEREYYPVKSKEGIFYIYSSCDNNILKGDVVFVSGKVSFNKYFNYDVFLSGKIKNVVFEEVEVLKRKEKGLFDIFKDKIKNNLRKIFNPYNSDLGGMLLFGKSFSSNIEIKNIFQKIGLSHVVVTSGQHLSILIDIFGIVFGFLSFLFLSIFNFFFVIVFLFFVGFSVSLVRASVMFLYNFIGRIIGRVPDNLNNFLICFVLIVLVNPYVLFYDVGFKLSFLAVFGILFIFPLLKERFNKMGNSLFQRYFVDLMIISFCVLLSTYPYLAYTFSEVSLIGPLANLLLIPFVFPIILGVLFLAGLSFV